MPEIINDQRDLGRGPDYEKTHGKIHSERAVTLVTKNLELSAAPIPGPMPQPNIPDDAKIQETACRLPFRSNDRHPNREMAHAEMKWQCNTRTACKRPNGRAITCTASAPLRRSVAPSTSRKTQEPQATRRQHHSKPVHRLPQTRHYTLTTPLLVTLVLCAQPAYAAITASCVGSSSTITTTATTIALATAAAAATVPAPGSLPAAPAALPAQFLGDEVVGDKLHDGPGLAIACVNSAGRLNDSKGNRLQPLTDLIKHYGVDMVSVCETQLSWLKSEETARGINMTKNTTVHAIFNSPTAVALTNESNSKNQGTFAMSSTRCHQSLVESKKRCTGRIIVNTYALDSGNHLVWMTVYAPPNPSLSHDSAMSVMQCLRDEAQRCAASGDLLMACGDLNCTWFHGGRSSDTDATSETWTPSHRDVNVVAAACDPTDIGLTDLYALRHGRHHRDYTYRKRTGKDAQASTIDYMLANTNFLMAMGGSSNYRIGVATKSDPYSADHHLLLLHTDWTPPFTGSPHRAPPPLMSTSRWNLNEVQQAAYLQQTSDVSSPAAIGWQIREAVTAAKYGSDVQTPGGTMRWPNIAMALHHIEYRQDCTLTTHRISEALARTMLRPRHTRALDDQVQAAADLLRKILGAQDYLDLQPVRAVHAQHMTRLKTQCHELLHTAAIAACHRPTRQRRPKPSANPRVPDAVDQTAKFLELLQRHFDPANGMTGTCNPMLRDELAGHVRRFPITLPPFDPNSATSTQWTTWLQGDRSNHTVGVTDIVRRHAKQPLDHPACVTIKRTNNAATNASNAATKYSTNKKTTPLDGLTIRNGDRETWHDRSDDLLPHLQRVLLGVSRDYAEPGGTVFPTVLSRLLFSQHTRWNGEPCYSVNSWDAVMAAWTDISQTLYDTRLRLLGDQPLSPQLFAKATDLNISCHPPLTRQHTVTILDTFEWIIDAIDSDIDAVWHALQKDGRRDGDYDADRWRAVDAGINTVTELTDLLSCMNTNRTSVGVSLEHVKHAGPPALEAYLLLIQDHLQGDQIDAHKAGIVCDQAKNQYRTRPIKLSQLVQLIPDSFHATIEGRIMAEDLPERTQGGIPGRWMTDLILLRELCIDNANRAGRPLFGMLKDAATAFNRSRQDMQQGALLKISCPDHVCAILAATMSRHDHSFKFQDEVYGIGDAVIPDQGLPQGGPASMGRYTNSHNVVASACGHRVTHGTPKQRPRHNTLDTDKIWPKHVAPTSFGYNISVPGMTINESTTVNDAHYADDTQITQERVSSMSLMSATVSLAMCANGVPLQPPKCLAVTNVVGDMMRPHQMTTIDTSGNVLRAEPTAVPACGILDSSTGADGTVRYLGSSSATRPPKGAVDRHHVALTNISSSVLRLVHTACREHTEMYKSVIQLMMLGMITTPLAGCQPTKAFTQLLDDHVAGGYLRALGVDPHTVPTDVADRLMLPPELGGAGLPSIDLRQDLTSVQTILGILCGRPCEVRTALLAELQAATGADLNDNTTATRMLHRLEQLGVQIHRATAPDPTSATTFTDHARDNAMATLQMPMPDTLLRALSTREAGSKPPVLSPANPTGLWSPLTAVALGSTIVGMSPYIHVSDFWQTALKYAAGNRDGVHLIAALDKRALDSVIDLTDPNVLHQHGFRPGSKAYRFATSDRELLFTTKVHLPAPTQTEVPATQPPEGHRSKIVTVLLDVSRLLHGRDPCAEDLGHGILDSLSTASLVHLANWASYVVQTHRHRHSDHSMPLQGASDASVKQPDPHSASYRRLQTTWDATSAVTAQPNPSTSLSTPPLPSTTATLKAAHEQLAATMATQGLLDHILVWVYYEHDDVNGAGYYLCAFYSTDSPSEIALHQINFASDDHIAYHTHHNHIIDRSNAARRSARLSPGNPFNDRTKLQCRPILPRGSGNCVEVHDITASAATCPLWFLATDAPCSFDDFCDASISLVAPPPGPRQLITTAFAEMSTGCRHMGANTWLKRANHTALGPDLHPETTKMLRRFSDTRNTPVSDDTVPINPRTYAAAMAWSRMTSLAQRSLTAASDLTVAFCPCNLHRAEDCRSHCPRATNDNADLEATPPGTPAVCIAAAAVYDTVNWTCICGHSTHTSEAFECHLVDQARSAPAMLHGRVLHQRPTSAQHSVLFDPNSHQTLSTHSELIDILGHDDNTSMDVEAVAAIKAEQQRWAAPTDLKQHGCRMGTDSQSTILAVQHRRSELNYRRVQNRPRARYVSTLATIDDAADLETGPDGSPVQHDRDHIPAWHDQAADCEYSVQNVLNDVCDLGSKAIMRDEIYNLLPSAAKRHRAHQPMTTTDADPHYIALHNGEALLGGIQPTVTHLSNSTRLRRAATDPDPNCTTQAQQHQPYHAILDGTVDAKMSAEAKAMLQPQHQDALMRNQLDVMALQDVPPYTTIAPPLYQPAMIQHHRVTRKTTVSSCVLCQNHIAPHDMQRHLCHECAGMSQHRELHHDSLCTFLARSGSCFWTAPALRTGDIAANCYDRAWAPNEQHPMAASDMNPWHVAPGSPGRLVVHHRGNSGTTAPAIIATNRAQCLRQLLAQTGVPDSPNWPLPCADLIHHQLLRPRSTSVLQLHPAVRQFFQLKYDLDHEAMVTPLSACSNVFPGLPEFSPGLSPHCAASRALSTPRHLSGANRFVAVRGDRTVLRLHSQRARLLAQTSGSTTVIAFEDVQLMHPDQVRQHMFNREAPGHGTNTTIVMRCPQHTLLVGDDVGWGHGPTKPPATANSETQISKDAQAHWRRTHWTLDAHNGSIQCPGMHDISCLPRDHSLLNQHPVYFIVVRPDPHLRANSHELTSNADTLSTNEHDHISLVLMHTSPNPPPGDPTRRAVWSGNGADKSLAPNDCYTGQTATHLRCLRHLLWFPTQIKPVPVPPIEPTNLVAQLAAVRERHGTHHRDSVRAGMVPAALTALLRVNGDSASSAMTTVTLMFGEQARYLLCIRRSIQTQVRTHYERIGIATWDTNRNVDPSAMHRLCDLCHLPHHRLGTVGGSTNDAVMLPHIAAARNALTTYINDRLGNTPEARVQIRHIRGLTTAALCATCWSQPAPMPRKRGSGKGLFRRTSSSAADRANTVHTCMTRIVAGNSSADPEFTPLGPQHDLHYTALDRLHNNRYIDASSRTGDRYVITIDRDRSGSDKDKGSADTGSDTDSDTDDVTSIDNTVLWLCHKPSDDPDHYDDSDGAGSNPAHRPCPDCTRRLYRKVRLMQRWAITTKATLPTSLRAPSSKGKGKTPLATSSRDLSKRSNVNKAMKQAAGPREQAPSTRPSRRGPAETRRNDARTRTSRTPSATTTTPITLHAPTSTSPRPRRAPIFSPSKRRHKHVPTTTSAQPQTELKRQRPHKSSAMPGPKRRRDQNSRNLSSYREWSAEYNNPTGNALAPRARNDGLLSAAPCRLDVWATLTPPNNPPESDRAATDRDQAPPATYVHQNTDKRRRAPGQDAGRPSRREKLRSKLRALRCQPEDSTLQASRMPTSDDSPDPLRRRCDDPPRIVCNKDTNSTN